MLWNLPTWIRFPFRKEKRNPLLHILPFKGDFRYSREIRSSRITWISLNFWRFRSLLSTCNNWKSPWFAEYQKYYNSPSPSFVLLNEFKTFLPMTMAIFVFQPHVDDSEVILEIPRFLSTLWGSIKAGCSEWSATLQNWVFDHQRLLDPFWFFILVSKWYCSPKRPLLCICWGPSMGYK